MNDAELTELAAKAFGIAPAGFSPLTDDGDALRLVVKLKILVSYENGQVNALPPNQSSDDFFEAHEKYKPDPYAVTRRAIVRAAAGIGRSRT